MIRILTNGDTDFYTLVGPFLSRRAIVRELGHPVWDEDGKLWFVWADPDVCGFCSLMEGPKVQLGSDYVLPEFRRLGIYRELFAARMAQVPAGKRVEAVATADSLPMFLEWGFSIRGTRGRYTIVIWSKE